MNDRLIDYALNQLDPIDKRKVDQILATDAAAAAKLSNLQRVLNRLTADREPHAPPTGLALAAISHTANFLVENGLFTTRDGVPGSIETVSRPLRENRWLPISQVHANIAVAACITFLVAALGLVGVQRIRKEQQIVVCQNNLRELHSALTGYSETHHGQYPQPGTSGLPVAGSFLDELTRSGQPVSVSARTCPLIRNTEAVGYAYSLGYRDPSGRLTGLQKPDSADDLTPISADIQGEDSNQSGHRGWNVLTIGGSVRYTTISTIGVNGDDIFRNDDGVRRAGLHRNDVSLGRPFDLP
jgi:hypothetical protein